MKSESFLVAIIAICRPIDEHNFPLSPRVTVSPAWEEPCHGWVDSLNGPIGIMVGGAKGVIRTMMCDGSLRSEVVPVDIAINGLIAIGYKIGTTVQK